MKIELTKPDGTPYLTLSADRQMVTVQMHDYDWLNLPVKFTFDKRVIPALIEGLQKLKEDVK